MRVMDSAAVADSFTAFCASWMEKLGVREADNVKKILWRQNGSSVEGEYVGYSKEHTCALKAPGGPAVPIGKVNYRELRYRKHGSSPDAAATSVPEVVEITEVTEIFRYDKGKWVY